MSDAPHLIDTLFHAMVAAGASDLHLSRRLAADHPQGRPHAAARSAQPRRSASDDVEALLAPIMPERTARSSPRGTTPTSRTRSPGLARFRANVFVDRKGPGAVFRVIPAKILTAEQLGPLAAHPAALPAEQGARARHRPDRLRQVDDAVRDDRLHQPHARGSHHHDRGSDRVRAPEPEVPDQPARGRARTPTRSRTRCAPRCARIRTSSSSASCAISRPSPSPSRPPRPDTSSSARCTRRPPRRPSTASSISFRPTGRRRSASCCRNRCAASSRRICAARSAAAASPRSRC